MSPCLRGEQFGLYALPLELIPVFLVGWRLNYFYFPENEARSMGFRHSAYLILAHICTTFVTAAIVSTCGVISWVGLLVPQVARGISGADMRKLLPMSCILGAIFLLVTDDICRTLLPQEIPLGIVTALVGTPWFAIRLLKSSS